MKGLDRMDIEKLREALLDYYGTAMDRFPAAMMDVLRVQEASEEELVQMGLALGIVRIAESADDDYSY